MKHIVVVDQGTTNTKALLVSENGTVVASASERVNLSFPRPSWAESDAFEVWLSVRRVLDTCLSAAPAASVVGLGVSNQRESVVAWDARSGEPLGPLVSWQCLRGHAITEAVRVSVGDSPWITERSGLPLDPMFSASKMRWLVDQIPNGFARASAGEICLGTVDAWILWNLSGAAVFATDTTNASRTLLMNLETCRWDRELTDAFGIPLACLPTITPSACVYGQIRLDHAAFHPEAVLAGVAGDSHAAFVGHRAFRPGVVKATFGTGTSVMAPCASIPPGGALAATVAWTSDLHIAKRATISSLQYAAEGNVIATGAALEWTATLLGLGMDVGRLESLAASCTPQGEFFVPALAGLGAPHWEPTARGIISGLTRATQPAHIARAAFASVAHQVADVLDSLRTLTGFSIDELRVDGGAMQSDFLAQMVSDITGVVVRRSAEPQLAAMGVGTLVGLTIGMWPNLSRLPPEPAPDRFVPMMSDGDRTTRRSQWREALHRTLMKP